MVVCGNIFPYLYISFWLVTVYRKNITVYKCKGNIYDHRKIKGNFYGYDGLRVDLCLRVGVVAVVLKVLF